MAEFEPYLYINIMIVIIIKSRVKLLAVFP